MQKFKENINISYTNLFCFTRAINTKIDPRDENVVIILITTWLLCVFTKLKKIFI